MSFNIRKLVLQDIDPVYELGNLREEFTTESGSFWTKEQLEKWSESEDDLMLVAESDGKIVGFSFYAQHIPTKKFVWENIYVSPGYRNHGIGAALILTGLKEIKKLGGKYVVCNIYTNDESKFSKQIEKFGFKKFGNVLLFDQVIN